jgi:hypothetical protein
MDITQALENLKDVAIRMNPHPIHAQLMDAVNVLSSCIENISPVEETPVEENGPKKRGRQSSSTTTEE